MKYYAVVNGRTPGIFTDWNEVQESVRGFSCNHYRGFNTYNEAEEYMDSHFDRNSDASDDYYESDEPDEPDYIWVYIDGACRNNGRNDASGGIGLYWGEDDNRTQSITFDSNRYGVPTNSKAELLAAKYALEQIVRELQNRTSSYIIYTDSTYVINSITVWARNYASNGWRTSNGEPVQNKSLIQNCVNLFNRANNMAREEDDHVIFKHVAGHSGVHGNEKADMLAQRAADEYRNYY